MHDIMVHSSLMSPLFGRELASPWSLLSGQGARETGISAPQGDVILYRHTSNRATLNCGNRQSRAKAPRPNMHASREWMV